MARRTKPATESQPDDPQGPVRLASLYGYFADDGTLRIWQPGSLVTDPDEVADLIARGAPLEDSSP